MALLQNGFRDSTMVFQTFGATASNNAYPSAHHANTHRTGAMRNLSAGEGITDDTVSLPSGNRHPNCWMMPQKAGALAARNTLVGEGDVSDADMWLVKLAEAALTGSGTLTAAGSLIVQLIAAITGSGTITAANLQAYLQLAAAISGSGAAAGSLTGFGALLAAVAASGTAGGSTLTGLGELDADLKAYGDLTNEGVRDSVWNAVASQYNESGTMGAKLNTASSGGVDLNALAQAVWEYATRNLSTSPPTAEQVATAILDAAQAAPIHSDIRKVNAVTVTGGGTLGNEWGPA